MINIKKISLNIFEEKRFEIAKKIYENYNYGHEIEWYTMKEALCKAENLKEHIMDGTAIPYVAEIDNEIVGFVWGYPCADRGKTGRVYISILQVDEKHRGKKIGSLLVETIEKEAINKGYNKIWLHTDGYRENPAIKFYEKIGFDKERIQYVKDI